MNAALGSLRARINCYGCLKAMLKEDKIKTHQIATDDTVQSCDVVQPSTDMDEWQAKFPDAEETAHARSRAEGDPACCIGRGCKRVLQVVMRSRLTGTCTNLKSNPRQLDRRQNCAHAYLSGLSSQPAARLHKLQPHA